ncbi:hypothetical protein BW39_05793 [Delftia sp. RIT313]|nr:hypothetical protein BW39_05793 [Delftia sp. RIT313]
MGIHACGLDPGALLDIGLCSQRYHRKMPQRAARAQGARGTEAVHAGHVHVHEHGIERLAVEQLQRLQTVLRSLYRYAGLLQQLGGHLAVEYVVIHHQHPAPRQARVALLWRRAGRRVFRLGRFGVPQRLTDAGPQCRCGQGLDQQAPQAKLRGTQLHFVAPEGRDHERSRGLGQVLSLAHAARQLQSVHAGHAPVQQGQAIGGFLACGLLQHAQRLHAVRRRIAAHAQSAHHGGQRLARVGVVIDDENARAAQVVVAVQQCIRGKPDLGLEAEVAALAGLAAHTDLAAHELHQPVADGQAQAGAAVAARGLDVGLGEGLEQPLGPRCIQAYAGVAHAHAQVVQGRCRGVRIGIRRRVHRWRRQMQGDHHLAMLGELDGVADQVGQHLAQAHWVAAQTGRQVRVQRIDHFQPLFLCAQRRGGRHGLQHIVKGEVHFLQRQHARLYFGEIEDVVDHGQKGAGRALHLLQVAALARCQRGLLHQARHADDGIHGCADFVAHDGQEIRFGAFGRFGGFLGLMQRLLGLALAGDVQHDAVPDHALLTAPGGRAAAQPADLSVGPDHAKAAIEDPQRIDRALHHPLVERQVLGMDGIQVDLPIGHDGVGRHADQVLYAGADVAEPQLRQAAFQAVDGAAGQVVGQGFEAHACVLAFGQVLQRAAERDDAALLVAQGPAHEAGSELPAVRAALDHIDAVGLAGADAQIHGSGEPCKILRPEHGAQGMALQWRTLGVQAVHHIHHLRGLKVPGVQLPCPAAQARQLFGLAQHVVAFLQLGLGLAHEGDVARNAQHAHGPALGIAIGNLGGLEDAALPVDQQMIVHHHGRIAVQHPAVAVGEAAVGEKLLVGLAHDVFGRAPGKARCGGVGEGVAALPVLGEDQVGRLAHHGLQQARRVLPRPGAVLQVRLKLRIGLADRLVLAGAFAEVVPGSEEKPPARQ